MPTRILAALVVLAFLAIPTHPLTAQEPEVIAPAGAKVQIHTPDAVLTGRLAGLLTGGDSAVGVCSASVTPCDGAQPTTRLPTLIDVDLARGTHWKRGAIVGGVVGAVGGGFIGYIVGVTCESITCSPTIPKIGIGALAGSVALGAVGALIGSLFTRS